MKANSRLDEKSAPCTACSTRREFLGQAAAAAFVAAFGFGLTADPFTALPVLAGEVPAENGEERIYPIPAADSVSFDKKNQVILVRFQQAVYAFALSCPHENAALRWREKDNRFQCPRHESKYTPDGTFISGRATRNLDRFGITRKDDSVVVDLARYYRSDEKKDEWTAAVVAL